MISSKRPPAFPTALATLVLLLTGALFTPAAGQTTALYETRCAACHGEAGTGDGPAAYLVYPKPRDFTRGVFRFKSTPGNQPPTRADLERVILGGIERTAMPAFSGVLSDADVEALVELVLGFLPEDVRAREPEPVTIPPPPAFGPEVVEQGARLYTAAGCAACHGETGHGDGPSSHTLVDEQGFPLPPADLTTGVFKAGRQPEDLYRTLVLGVPGTPMPAYAGTLSDLDTGEVEVTSDPAWALVAYLESLVAPSSPEGVRAGAVLAAATPASTPAMLEDPWHPAWEEVEATAVSLQPLWQRRGAQRSVRVRLANAGGEIAIALEWEDPTMDAAASSVYDFTDAAALMFSLDEEPPPITMGGGMKQGGSVEPTAPVHVWHWQASRELTAEAGRLRDLPPGASSEAGGVPVDLYMFQQGEGVPGRITEHDPTFVPAWREGNPLADPALLERAVLESNAAGFGTLTLQPAEGQQAEGRGRWSDGRWRVVMVRSAPSPEEGDVDLSGAGRVPVAFAVWDGSKGDRNGTKLVSGWHFIETSSREEVAARTGGTGGVPARERRSDDGE